jgi:8-oxo-dGTP diphosphatase
MDLSRERCPECGNAWPRRSPSLTVDIVIELGRDSGSERDSGPRIVLVKRKNPPHGWALPGGFVDYGETVEAAAVREAYEETGLRVQLVRQIHTYSEPARDPRGHTVSVVFLARASGEPKGGDDASVAKAFDPAGLPQDVVFDHRQVVEDYVLGRY